MPDDPSENSIEAQIDKWLEEHKEIKGMLDLSSDAMDTLSDINSWVGTAMGVLIGVPDTSSINLQLGT